MKFGMLLFILIVCVLQAEDNEKETKDIAKFRLILSFKFTHELDKAAVVFKSIAKNGNCYSEEVKTFIEMNDVTCEDLTKLYAKATGFSEK